MSLSILIKDSAGDSSPVTIATAGDNVSDFRVNGQQIVQSTTTMRAANGGAKNRGNVTNSLTLSVKLAPAASPEAAKQAAAALIVAITAKLATFTVLDLTFATALFRLSAAALQDYDIRTGGTTVFADYKFVGGAFAEITP